MQASQLGLDAFIRPVQADALGFVDQCQSQSQSQNTSQAHQQDTMPAKMQQQLAARKSVANVLEQLDDIMQVCAFEDAGIFSFALTHQNGQTYMI